MILGVQELSWLVVQVSHCMPCLVQQVLWYDMIRELIPAWRHRIDRLVWCNSDTCASRHPYTTRISCIANAVLRAAFDSLFFIVKNYPANSRIQRSTLLLIGVPAVQWEVPGIENDMYVLLSENVTRA